MASHVHPGKSRIVKDLGTLLAVAVTSLVLLEKTRSADSFLRFSANHPDWNLVEVSLTLPVVLTLALAMLLLRARRETPHGVAGRPSGRLTGTLPRSVGQDLLDLEIQRAKRYQRPLSLVLCDVDRLQEVNDSHGRAAGDRTVAAVEQLIQKHLRSTDLLVHWGEDEFLVLCLESDLDAARKTAERLRETIEHHRSSALPRPVTASFGVAQLRNEEALVPFLERIDTQLRKAKSGGRNQLAISGAPA